MLCRRASPRRHCVVPEAFNFCPRCGVTISDKAESDDKYELCYKCDLEVSESAGGWASWNRNRSPSYWSRLGDLRLG